MNMFTERDPRFAGLEHRVRIFGLSALAALFMLFVAIAVKHDWFTRTTHLYFFAQSASGLSKGMAVKLIGFKVGNVEEIGIEPNATVRVKLAINSEHVRLIPQDSKARLTKEGLIGDSMVEIVPGTQPRQVANNGVLAFERGHGVEELANDLKPILEDVKRITASINDPDGDIRQSIKNLNRATTLLVETEREIKTLARNGNQKLGKLDQVLDSAGSSAKAVNQSLPGLLQKTENTLENLQAVTADAKKITAASAEQAPRIVQDAGAVAADSREIVDATKKSWPIRYMIDPPEEKELRLDSYDVGTGKPHD